MKTKKTNLQIMLVLLAVCFVWVDGPAMAQSVTESQKPTGAGGVKTDSRILYHNGLVLTGPADVYSIWYGCWDNNCGNYGDTAGQSIMTDFNAMANTLAHVLSTTITNPYGSGWFDRYDLQNADKCDGQFGPTYLTASGARANLKRGQREYLIQENWVNAGKGRCALNQVIGQLQATHSRDR